MELYKIQQFKTAPPIWYLGNATYMVFGKLFCLNNLHSPFQLYEKKLFFFRENEKHMRGIDIVLMFFVTNKIDIL